MRKLLGLLDGCRPDQHRLSRLMATHHFPHDRSVFPAFRLINGIRQIDADFRLIRRNLHDIHAVNFDEFLLFRLRRPRHARQFVVHTEIILERNCRKRLAFPLDLQPFLRFNRLMKPIGITTPMHETTRKFIDDDDFPIFHDIVLVPRHHELRPKRLREEMIEFQILSIVKIAHAEHLFHFRHARFRRRDRLLFLVDCKIFVLHQLRHIFRQDIVIVRRFLSRTGNDERRARFIDQNGVHFVNQAIMKRPLHHLIDRRHHIVAQIIKTEFIVRPVCDIGRIRQFPG